MIRLALLLFLMCENVNAAPQASGRNLGSGTSDLSPSARTLAHPAVDPQGSNDAMTRGDAGNEPSGDKGHSMGTPPALPVGAAPLTLASDMPPFKIADPMCNTGFTISQRLDTRNAAGTIIKSVWVRKCTNGRIVYGRKV